MSIGFVSSWLIFFFEVFISGISLSELLEENGDCGCQVPNSLDKSADNDDFVLAKKIESSFLTHQEVGIIRLKGGMSLIGTNSPILGIDGENPARKLKLNEFFLDKYEVSNAQFINFIYHTGYVTENEKYGWSFVFESAASDEIRSSASQTVADAPWWIPVNNTDWLHPEGPDSNVFTSNRGNHPVTQVSWNDAAEFCRWRGGRLPTEAEWEYAARGPQDPKYFSTGGYIFPWGDVFLVNGSYRANIWQGNFPTENLMLDGYHFTAPVDAYGPQNIFGFHNMIGNVWEWIDDWWSVPTLSNAQSQHTATPSEQTDKVKKGGSYLCHKKFCYRYRVVARTRTSPDSATSNCGFRCAMDSQVLFPPNVAHKSSFNGSHYSLQWSEMLKLLLWNDDGSALIPNEISNEDDYEVL